MITPVDIQKMEFSKGVRGYKEDEVDGFLDLITADMESLIRENNALKAEVERLNGDIAKYRGSEGAVLDTLEAAKALMGDISSSAEKRAQILLKNAELDAELITREARESVDKLKEENAALQNRYSSFRAKFRTLLETELEKFDSLSAEIFADMEKSESESGFAKARPSVAADLRAEARKTKDTRELEKPGASDVFKDDMRKTRVFSKVK